MDLKEQSTSAYSFWGLGLPKIIINLKITLVSFCFLEYSPHSFLWPKKTMKGCSLTFLSALPSLFPLLLHQYWSCFHQRITAIPSAWKACPLIFAWMFPSRHSGLLSNVSSSNTSILTTLSKVSLSITLYIELNAI